MISMRYKDFIWPNNPANCHLTVKRQLASHKYPGASYVLEDLGEESRILRGNGEFFGPDAYYYLTELLRVYREPGPGRLLHPVIQMEQACFAELTITEEPCENYAAYSFVFYEDGRGSDQSASAEAGTSGQTVTILENQSLWEIAAMYDTTVEKLMAANLWIANPNILTAGGQVKIP